MNHDKSTSEGRRLIIAVDGPAGSGKSSVCQEACSQMNWIYLNTGALYRAIAFIGQERGINIHDEKLMLEVAVEFVGNFCWDIDKNKLIYKNTDLSESLLSENLGHMASSVASQAKIRELLVPVQREIIFSAPRTVLADGRDIGTVIAPDADVKIFMTASIEARAQRRLQQLQNRTNQHKKSEIESDFESIKVGITQRDKQDSQRSFAPLTQAKDAVLFDTSHLDKAQSVAKLIDIIKNKK